MDKNTYRGKRKDNGEWVQGSLLYDRENNEAFIAVSFEDRAAYLNEVIPETVGQCTGLKDKNGKAIFEGDVCRNTRTKEIVSVKWHGTMAGYVWSKRDKDGFLYSFGELFRAHDKYEIIGNIHDNPEILEGV